MLGPADILDAEDNPAVALIPIGARVLKEVGGL